MNNTSERDYRRLQMIRGRFAGRRGFIVGNGPSLRVDDLERLHAAGEVTLACNKIHLIFTRTVWRPTVYAVEDEGVALSGQQEIGRYFAGNVVYADYLAAQIPEEARYAAFHLKGRVSPPQQPSFATDFADGVVCGGTVTYTMLQLAYWLGLRDVYLLGVDFNYTLPDLRPSTVFPGFKTYSPDATRNYFADDYIKPDEAHVAPDIEASMCAFQAARRKSESTGWFKVFNATRGGKLEVFPRVDFDSLFAGVPPAAPVSPPLLAPADLGTLACPDGLPRAAKREMVELTEALCAVDFARLRLYSFVDHLAEARIKTSGPYAKVAEGNAVVLGSEARTIFIHPPARASFTIPVGNPGCLTYAVTLHPEVWANPETGPCRFLVRVDGSVASDQTVDVRTDPAARRWLWGRLDIRESKNGKHLIEFETISVGSTAFRWAIWRAPVFIWGESDPEKHADFIPQISKPPAFCPAGEA